VGIDQARPDPERGPPVRAARPARRGRV